MQVQSVPKVGAKCNQQQLDGGCNKCATAALGSSRTARS